ncbi:MAG: ABC-three component system middle component 7 [Limosilactobacillus pontis]
MIIKRVHSANLPKILKALDKDAMNPQQLLQPKRYFDDVGEFVESLDCLFTLGKIRIDKETGDTQC